MLWDETGKWDRNNLLITESPTTIHVQLHKQTIKTCADPSLPLKKDT